MTSPHEAKLRQKANTFIQQVGANLGYDALLDADSFEEYSVAIQFGDAGFAQIYYSPKRDYYSLTTPKLEKTTAGKIRKLWDGSLAAEAKPHVLKIAQTPYQAFVDGSFDSGKQAVGYGAVILKQGDEVARLSGSVQKYIESYQIAGELSATMRVIAWCQQNDVSAIDIFYDYKGIEQWATGGWQLDKPMAQEYAKFMQETGIAVHWHKVASHSGVHWNEVADKLAKQGTQAVTAASLANPQPDDETLLVAIGEAFATHLNDNGIQVAFDSVKNGQYARLLIYSGEKRVGFFDLYNTKKRPLDPYLHGFDDRHLQSRIEKLWADYKKRL